ncbi:MAG: diguanylate cyclase [Proteobacteria bacterium]|nr:diguanylate cyclase [Pseudomonadota bacterium]
MLEAAAPSLNLPSIMVVDDEHENLALLERTLALRYEVQAFFSPQQALERLAHQRVDLIISDHRMPHMTGVEFLSRACQAAPETPRILLTGHADLETAMEAVNRGRVSGFLRKPIDADRLLGEVERCMGYARLCVENRRLTHDLARTNRELSEAKRLLELDLDARTRDLLDSRRKLEEMVTRDGLTGLFNHRYFQEAAQNHVAAAVRHGHPIALIFLDVDWFKVYNDTRGHPAGDELLRTLAGLLVQASSAMDAVVCRLRQDDVVARYGGEEFVLLLPHTNLQGALAVAERLREVINAHPFAGGETQPLGRVTVSMGLAELPTHGRSKLDLVHKADAALLQAKANGRDMVLSASELSELRAPAGESTADAPPPSGLAPGERELRLARIERRLAREKLARGQIEHLLEEKSRDLYLAMRQLKEQQGMLVQTEKLSTLGRISAGIAHEINNALNIVYGNAQHLERYSAAYGTVLDAYRRALAEQPGLAEQLRSVERAARIAYIERDLPKLVGAINTGVDRAATIVRDLGIFSRPQDADALHWTDLGQIMATALTLASNQLKLKHVVCEDAPASLLVHCNAGKLSQVFLNILLNAAHATPDGGSIEVSYQVTGELVTVRISDAGCGIAPEHQHRVFEPFFTTKDPGTGTGLGLFLCLQLVQSQGGRIWFESVLQQGTSFFIEFQRQPVPRAGQG